jgi:2-keto-4-pentenoate hydratase/2-oxohepta-3-ene-1,7-dioic acid hydratase in catechol pathway
MSPVRGRRVQLVTYYEAGARTSPRIGILEEDTVIDLAGAAAAMDASPGGMGPPSSMLSLLRLGDGLGLARRCAEHARRTGGSRLRRAEVKLAAPLPRPNSIRDFMLVEEHVKNSFGQVPEEWFRIPAHWKGNPDTVIGPDDEVPWPYYTGQLDYELEVAAILGRPAYRVTPEDALGCIAGYTIFNDWSARDIQFREMKVGIGPAFGKDFATSMGPAITTADSIDIAAARMTARVNGQTWSEGNLGTMIFSFADVISAVSAVQPLHPGDVFGSGTIGRGCGLELGRWIQPGDVVELEVSGIGILRNVIGPKGQAPRRGIDLAASSG